MAEQRRRKMSLISEIVEDGVKYFKGDADRKYPYITDASGRALVVNVKTGEVFSCYVSEDNMPYDVRRYAVGSESRKKDGYLVSIYKRKPKYGCSYKNYYLRQHVLVAMVTHNDQYQDLVIEHAYYNPVVCHKNGCPWDNRPENLEWGRQFYNNFHGKLCNELNKSREGVYTHLVKNLSGRPFIVLNQPIENAWLEEFLEANKDFEVPKEKEYMGADKADEIVHFLLDRGYWHV